MANQLAELSELSQWEDLTDQMCHPVDRRSILSLSRRGLSRFAFNIALPSFLSLSHACGGEARNSEGIPAVAFVSFSSIRQLETLRKCISPDGGGSAPALIPTHQHFRIYCSDIAPSMNCRQNI